MEPAYIFEEFVEAKQATDRCGEAEAGQREKFLRNFGAIRRRAAANLAEADPDASPDAIEVALDERAVARRDRVDALIDANGCADKEVWAMMRRFEIRARLNLH